MTKGNNYPFGSTQGGRGANSAEYRYGFNGKENDGEWGTSLVQDYGFRLYNPGIGRFLSVDPLAISFPWNSPYSFGEGDITRSIDLDGLEKKIVIYWTGEGGISSLYGAKLSLVDVTVESIDYGFEGRPQTVVYQGNAATGEIYWKKGVLGRIYHEYPSESGMTPSSYYDYRNPDDLEEKKRDDAKKNHSWQEISKRDKQSPERLWDAVNDAGEAVFSQMAVITMFKLQKMTSRGLSLSRYEKNLSKALVDAAEGKVRTVTVRNVVEANLIGETWVGKGYTKIYRTRKDGTKYLSAYESADKHRRYRLPVRKKNADGTYTGRYDGNLEYRKDPNLSWGNKGAVKRSEKTNTHIGIQTE